MKFFDKNCKHELWFKEHNQKTWYCRYCFTEMKEDKNK
jgi:hypothetical protein